MEQGADKLQYFWIVVVLIPDVSIWPYLLPSLKRPKLTENLLLTDDDQDESADDCVSIIGSEMTVLIDRPPLPQH